MNEMRTTALAAAVLAVAACTSVNVRPVPNAAALQEVCIVRNPAVMVSDFIPVLQDGFNRHGIRTRLVEPQQPNDCATMLTYTALRSWDFSPYLSHAELRMWRDGLQIGAADYHLRGKGGFSLNKWSSTREKIDPVIDQLLGGQRQANSAPPPDHGGRAPPPPRSSTTPPPSAGNCEACKKIGKP